MPLLYSINGRASTYERIHAIEPLAPAQPTFVGILSEQVSKEGTLAGPPPHHTLRGYDEEPNEIQRKRVQIAQDIMSKAPQCVSDSTLVGTAREIMEQHRFRHLPVASPDRRLSGMLSDRDILRAGEAHSKEPVSKYMTTRVLTATPETTIQHIAEAMLANKIHAIPIVDSEHRIIGILTSTDILRAIVQSAPIELWA